VNWEPWSECTVTRSIGLSSPDGHQQGLQGEVGGHAGLGRPANDPAREQVDDDAEIQPAFMGLDVGDVGHPDLIGPDASNRCSSLFSATTAGLPPYRPGRRL
jgi:hypothetical protein